MFNQPMRHAMLPALSVFLFLGSARAAPGRPAARPSPVVAAPVAGAWNLSVTEAVSTALQANADVGIARAAVDEARERVSLSRSQLFFTLDGVLQGQRRKDGLLVGSPAFGGESYNLYNADLLFNQPLFDSGAMWARMSEAKHNRRVQEIRLEMAERDVVDRVLSAYYSTWVTQERLQSYEKTLGVEREALETARHRSHIGRGQRLDQLQIETQAALLEAKVAQARADWRSSIVTLLYVMQSRDERPIALASPMRTDGIDSWLKSLDARSYRIPEFEEIEERQASLDSSTTVQMAKYWPSLALVADYGRETYSKNDLLKDYANAWSVGLVLKIPILAGFGSFSESGALAAQAKQLEIEQTRTQDAVVLAESEAMHNLEAARTTIVSSKKAYDFAEQSVAEARRNYRYATIDYLQFLTVQQSFLDARVARDQALLTYIQSVSKYMIATGRNLNDLIPILEGKR